jgi:hypothetical protein
MVVNKLKLSFVQIQTLIAPLASLGAQKIPYQFLLSTPLYKAEIGRAVSGQSAHHLPWDDGEGGEGTLFWFYYLEKKRIWKIAPDDAWRGLVPLRCDLDATVSAAWVPGTVALRGYLYPWGIAVVVDVQATGPWSLEQAVDLAFQIRSKGTFDWTRGAETTALHLNALLDRGIATLRTTAYGEESESGQAGEVFSVVTVLDGAEIDAEVPVEDGKELHKALDAWSGWNPYWKKNQPKPLTGAVIEIKQSPPGHLLYGGRRGRVVWFPAAFGADGLECYHGNLVAATLQTESLCRLADGVAKRLATGQTMGEFSVTCTNCTRLAAGILGRLYGGSFDTYRSHSVRDQIKRTYLDAVNTARNPGPWTMPALT